MTVTSSFLVCSSAFFNTSASLIMSRLLAASTPLLCFSLNVGISSGKFRLNQSHFGIKLLKRIPFLAVKLRNLIRMSETIPLELSVHLRSQLEGRVHNHEWLKAKLCVKSVLQFANDRAERIPRLERACVIEVDHWATIYLEPVFFRQCLEKWPPLNFVYSLGGFGGNSRDPVPAAYAVRLRAYPRPNYQ